MKQALCLLIALAVPTLSVQGASESFKSKIGSSKLTIFGDSTVHKWKVKGEELEYESGVINFFVMGFRPCEEEHARDILKELV